MLSPLRGSRPARLRPTRMSLAVTPSPSAWPRASPDRTASCSGPGWRLSRSGPIRQRRAAWQRETSPSPTRSPRTPRCERSSSPARRSRRRLSPIRCISRCGASRRADRTGTASRAGTPRAVSAGRGPPRRPVTRSASSASASSPAPTTSTGTSRPIGTSPTSHPDLVLFLGRLHLRVCRSSAADRPTAQRWGRGGDAARLSQPVRAVPARPGPPAAPRRGADARDLGRPRGPERLRRPVVGDVRSAPKPSWRGGPPRIRPSTSTCRSGRAGRDRRGPRSSSTTASPTATWSSSRCSTGGSIAAAKRAPGRQTTGAATSRPMPGVPNGGTLPGPSSARRRRPGSSTAWRGHRRGGTSWRRTC